MPFDEPAFFPLRFGNALEKEEWRYFKSIGVTQQAFREIDGIYYFTPPSHDFFIERILILDSTYKYTLFYNNEILCSTYEYLNKTGQHCLDISWEIELPDVSRTPSPTTVPKEKYQYLLDLRKIYNEKHNNPRGFWATQSDSSHAIMQQLTTLEKTPHPTLNQVNEAREAVITALSKEILRYNEPKYRFLPFFTSRLYNAAKQTSRDDLMKAAQNEVGPSARIPS